MELWEDGYRGDVIGEYPQDVLVTEIIWRKGIMSPTEMKGERGLIEQIFQTEIIIFHALCSTWRISTTSHSQRVFILAFELGRPYVLKGDCSFLVRAWCVFVNARRLSGI
ncbi:hypothetical protein V6N13_027203 [Hibiscus sabdariffa]|uniref:Uncharacterized protein n=1 Tax=Hibiscus sabdariffa TaxID=183260 RepID=A0ABR2NKF4_9ROSI